MYRTSNLFQFTFFFSDIFYFPAIYFPKNVVLPEFGKLPVDIGFSTFSPFTGKLLNELTCTSSLGPMSLMLVILMS